MDGREKKPDHKYQELLNVKNAVIYRMDPEGRLTYLNEEWQRITGYTELESLGTRLIRYVDPNGREVFDNVVRDLLQGHKDGEHREVRLISAGGQVILVHLFMRAELHEGSVTALSGTLTDLSSRKPGINSFLENESNFRFISEHLTDMVAVLAEDGLVLYASPSHTTILGRTLEEYIGSYPITHMHPDDWERVFQAFHRAVTEWSVFEIDYRCKHSNGHWVDIEMRGKPIKGPDGTTQVILVSRDITLRKQAERDLRQTMIKFKTLLASLPFGIKVEDEDGQPILTNEAYLSIFGPEEDGGDRAAGLNDRQQHTIMQRGTLQGEELTMGNGTILEWDAVPIMDHERDKGYLWIYRDVTETKRVEQSLRDANRQLQKLSMMDGLTGIANRRCFDEALLEEWVRESEREGNISLLMLDIDHFKTFNDLYGHQAGDECMRQIGRVLMSLPWGPRDVAARYGGEEFVVLLPGRSAEDALRLASAINQSVSGLGIPHKGASCAEFLTVSIGVSTKMATKLTPASSLVMEADKALYEAKRTGRNQCRVYKLR
ncbi:sensor domain-containing diguanylate cyclase [Gorillibacterium sp. sgz5001074]|uniref:sensor domain-containing diguanylate cyclase n=1 Tax=Gorillibacterium sp. sgz5001074 TaxID=3446695 RepID=UPI003F66572F